MTEPDAIRVVSARALIEAVDAAGFHHGVSHGRKERDEVQRIDARRHAMRAALDELERLQAAASGRTQSCAECERLQREVDRLRGVLRDLVPVFNAIVDEVLAEDDAPRGGKEGA